MTFATNLERVCLSIENSETCLVYYLTPWGLVTDFNIMQHMCQVNDMLPDGRVVPLVVDTSVMGGYAC